MAAPSDPTGLAFGPTWHIGDSLKVVPILPARSVDLVLTSPPYLGQRHYTDLPDEVGRDQNPAEYLASLLEHIGGWRRVLTKHASVAIDVGDTVATYERRSGRPDDWPIAHSLTAIPGALVWALAWGHNPFTGGESPAGRWRVRSTLTVGRTNPTPGHHGPRFAHASSTVIVASTSNQPWFDRAAAGSRLDHQIVDLDGGSTLLQLPRERQPGLGHNAVMPARVADLLVRSLCPAKVCTVCSKPIRSRVVDAEVRLLNRERSDRASRDGREVGGSWISTTSFRTPSGPAVEESCECDAPMRPGVVLDPFAGTGTTLAVAEVAARDSIGIELHRPWVDLWPERRQQVRRILAYERRSSRGRLR